MFGRLEDHQVYLGVVCHGNQSRLALVSGGHLRTCTGLYLLEHFVPYHTFLERVAAIAGKSAASVTPNENYTFSVRKTVRVRQ